jgi:hypothetical protein
VDLSAGYFAPYREVLSASLPQLGTAQWIEAFNAHHGDAVRLVANAESLKALAYEQCVYVSGAVPTRVDAVHDLMNAAVWSRFPCTKRAINSLHIADGARADSANARSHLRDGLTLWDEVGLIIACDDPVLKAAHARHDWQTLLIDARARWHNDIHITVFGHGLLESLATQSHPQLTGKALWIPSMPEAAWDGFCAGYVRAHADKLKATLLPLPVFGVPGWSPANVDPHFYANAAIFRPARDRP